jgi:hypothetical protein
MSAALRYRVGRLPVFLLAGFFVLALGSAAAWPAVRGGHGGLGGGGRVGMGVPRLGFGDGRFAGRVFGDHRFAHGRRGRRGFFPSFYYGGGYGSDQDYEYDARSSYPRGYWHSGYCDVSPHSYPQDCVWKDGP